MAVAKMTVAEGFADVTAQYDADFYRVIIGDGIVAGDITDAEAYEVVSNNQINLNDNRIYITEGRRIQIPVNQAENFIIENGAQGVVRYDIIGYRFYRDETGNELIDTFVEKDVGENGSIETANIRNGASECYIGLYKIKLNGLTLESVTPMFEIIKPLSVKKVDIKEIGSNQNARWIKYSDGTMDMWGCLSLPTANLAKTDGYLYYAADSVVFVYPEKFAETPVLQVTTQNSGKAIWAMVESVTTSSASFWLYGVKKEVITGTKVNWHACGRWK